MPLEPCEEFHRALPRDARLAREDGAAVRVDILAGRKIHDEAHGRPPQGIHHGPAHLGIDDAEYSAESAAGLCLIQGNKLETESDEYVQIKNYGTAAGASLSHPHSQLIATPINLGSNELIFVDDLVSIAEEIGNVKLTRKYDPTAPRGVAGRNSDNTLIRSILGWEPSTPLREGMSKTYAWIEQQYNDRKSGKRVVEETW